MNSHFNDEHTGPFDGAGALPEIANELSGEVPEVHVHGLHPGHCLGAVLRDQHRAGQLERG